MSRLRLPPGLRRDGSSECEQVRDLLSGYVDNELDAPAQRRVEEHVSFCPRCRVVLANLRRTLAALASVGATITPGADEATEAAKRAWRDRIR